MLADYHIHTKMCGHAKGELEQYILQAQAMGLDEIGFSDHIPMYFLPEEERDLSVAMAEHRLPEYINKIQLLQKSFYPYSIKIGIEADYSADHLPLLKDILGQYPFDYVLGSVHFIDGWGFDNPAYLEEYKFRNIDDIYEQYFSLIEQAAASGAFDIMAHPDLVKKMGYLPDKDITPLYERLATVFAEADLCVEINTAGLRAPIKEIFPAVPFLKECFKKKVPVTLGSDAHSPELVGANFKEARQLMLETGYNQIAVFNQRKRTVINL